ncbi:MAG: YggS family pyridoxal phosphate-dependent enzyme [Phycisphaerales bacterium]|nr:YggS family pyridoxal phosphate-dependent enzyme [Phycisphaerales bacterium]
MAKKSPLAERLDQVHQRIADACAKARRQPSEVMLVAVTKYAAPEQIRELVQLGVTDLGENKVQQLAQRAPQINEFFARRQAVDENQIGRLRWHMVGHLQRNKVKQILPLVSLIHSVDSLRLAEELNIQAGKLGRRVPVLLQINASEEASKSGVAVGASTHLAEQIASMENLAMSGVMTMGPLEASPAQIQAIFARVREIFEEMRWQKIGGNDLRYLSMGMSDDFELAIAEGANVIRIGSALFGPKPPDAEEVR